LRSGEEKKRGDKGKKEEAIPSLSSDRERAEREGEKTEARLSEPDAPMRWSQKGRGRGKEKK